MHDGSPVGRRAHDDVAELRRVAQAADRVHLHLEGRAGRRRLLADLAGRDLDILLGDGILHIDGGDAELGHLVGVEPDAHRIAPLAEDHDIADAGKALQRIGDLQIGVIAQSHGIDRIVRREEIDDQDEVGILLGDGDAALIDDARQGGRGLGDAVLHIDRGDVQRIADIEGDGDRR